MRKLATELKNFKYHVSCTDGKLSVRIIYFYYLFKDLKNTGKILDTQKANPNSLNMSLRKDIK